MELAQALFGNPVSGQYGITDRDRFQEMFCRLLCDVIDPNHGGYGMEFENDVFALRPYYWGGCTCGYEQKEAEWEQSNHHSPDCYQSRLTAALIFMGWTGDRCWLEKPRGMSYDKAHKTERQVRKRLCSEQGLPYPEGSAVHCTCDKQEKWLEWSSKNDHSADCLTVLPNFHYKPTDYRLSWYKYPMRSAYANQNLSYKEFRNILVKCVESLG